MNPEKKSEISTPGGRHSSGRRRSSDSKNNDVSKPGVSKPGVKKPGIQVGGPKTGLPSVGGAKPSVGGHKTQVSKPTVAGPANLNRQVTKTPTPPNFMVPTIKKDPVEQSTPVKKKTNSVTSIKSDKKTEKTRKKSLAPELKEAAIVSR